MPEQRFIDLPPFPLPRHLLEAASAELHRRLATQSLDDVAAERVESLYGWSEEQHPLRRRMKRNASLAYTREEIERAVRNDLERLLRTPLPEVPRG